MTTLLDTLEELKVKLMLTLARDRRAMQGRIRSVGFMREYLELPDDLGAQTLTHMGERAIVALAHSFNIKPKSEAAHFHFYLNDVRYRLVKQDNNKIALLNHIPISTWVACVQHGAVADKQLLLDWIASFSDKETKIVHLATLEQQLREQMEKLLRYCLFEGTENGAALHQAEGLFIFENAVNMDSWTLMSIEEAISYSLEHGYIELEQEAGQSVLSLYMK